MSDSPNPLADFWANHASSPERGWVHEADEPLLRKLSSVRVRWDAPATPADEIDEALASGDRVQAGLMPQPFVGDLRSPDVVICLTNPGFGRADFATERTDAEFVERKLANLRQTLPNAEYPFFEIDPALAATPAFGWWFPKIVPAINRIARQSGRTRWEAASEVARRVACVELFPYHSVTAGGWLDGLVMKLPSSLAAQAYVRERARAGTKVLICRRHRTWRTALALEADMPNVVDIKLTAITFSPHTPGGDALIRGLGYAPKAC